MKRYHAILAAASVAVLLAACGGGDDDKTTNVDVSGVWQSGATAFVYALDGVTYGYQIEGSTIRYFRGANYAATGNSFSFASSRYHEGVVNTVVTNANERTGSLSGSYLPSSDDITLSFTAAGAAPTFDPMTVKYQAIGNTAQSLLDYEGTYTIATGVTVVLDATSATSGTLVGTAVNGCNFNGTITRTRGDRNVWAVSLTQSSCTVDATRNGETSTGLATMGTSNTTKLLRVLSFDGKAWNRIETQK
jgi:uncharacterized lipoprotein YehR (DUF1307 family)